MIHLFITCLLSSYYVLGTGDTMMDKTDEVSIFKGMSDKQKNLNNVFSGNIKCSKEKYSKE